MNMAILHVPPALPARGTDYKSWRTAPLSSHVSLVCDFSSNAPAAANQGTRTVNSCHEIFNRICTP